MPYRTRRLRVVCVLPARQARPVRKDKREAEQVKRELTSRLAAGIASEPFAPTETIMRTQGTSEHWRWLFWLDREDDGLRDTQMLMVQYTDAQIPGWFRRSKPCLDRSI
ncbi:MAG TPA: hypothetical protein VFV38_19300 [Ktedonobacteraceae bacterium]|nr:hypothetical protein [Ktedonobacteraceae bacterium]